MNLSVPTDSDEVRKAFEPAAPSIDRRLEAAKELLDAGIKVGICVSPMTPILDPAAFGRRLADLRADAYSFSYFHRTNREFAANTGPKALALLDEFEWTKDKFEVAVARIKARLPHDRPAFSPA